MTLFMASVVDGFTLAYTQGQTVPSMPKVMLMIGRPIFEGAVLRWLLILTIVLTVVIELIIRKSKTGKSLYLVGSNRRAARLSGLNVNKEVMFAYIFSGMALPPLQASCWCRTAEAVCCTWAIPTP